MNGPPGTEEELKPEILRIGRATRNDVDREQFNVSMTTAWDRTNSYLRG